MRIFAVFRRRGAAFDPALPLEEQPAWGPHADYMMALAREGFVLLAGPMSDKDGALIIVRAENKGQVEERFAADPWTLMGLLETGWIAAWDLRIGTLVP